MKLSSFNLSHLLSFLLAFGGVFYVAYEGFIKTGAAITPGALAGLAVAAIGVTFAILNKAPKEDDTLAGTLKTLGDILTQLGTMMANNVQPANPPLTPAPTVTPAPPVTPDVPPSILKDTKGGARLDAILAFAAIVVFAVVGIVAMSSTTGCKLLQKDPQFAQDMAAESKCVGDELAQGDTDAVTIAARCFNAELKTAYDFLAALFDLPSFLATTPAEKVKALRSSHADLGFQLRGSVGEPSKVKAQ